MKVNIAVTGATGLLGNSLVDFFLENGSTVYVLMRDEHASLKLRSGVNRVYGNINSREDVDFFVHKSLPDVFIHLAAQTQAYDSLKYPYNTFYTNAIGTLNVLESLREYSSTKAIVVASSDKAYGELQELEYTESSPLAGLYPYDASKAITDMICRSYKRTYGLPVVTTRACNIFGIKDYNQQRLIPAIINSYKSGKKFVLRNGGEDVREYIHVSDVVNAYSHIINYVIEGGTIESFNISSGQRFATKEILQMIQDYVKSEIPVMTDPIRTQEIKKQFMNSDLLKSSTGWRPNMRFESSLKEIIEWYLKH